jgi:hypothetical protein
MIFAFLPQKQFASDAPRRVWPMRRLSAANLPEANPECPGISGECKYPTAVGAPTRH